MSAIDDALKAVRQERADMEYAMQQANEKGLTLGDYDLRSATAARKTDREREEREAQDAGITEERLTQDLQASPDIMGAPTASLDQTTTTLTEQQPPEEEPVAETPTEEVEQDEFLRLPEDNPYIKPSKLKESIRLKATEKRELGPEDFLHDINKDAEYREKYKGYQQKLNDKLVELYPDIEPYLERYMAAGAKERQEIVDEMHRAGVDHSLSTEQIRQTLTPEEFKDYNDLGYVLKWADKRQFGGSTAGRMEQAPKEDSGLERHGIRSAGLYRYTGEARTKEQEIEDLEFLRRQAGYDDFAPTNPASL